MQWLFLKKKKVSFLISTDSPLLKDEYIALQKQNNKSLIENCHLLLCIYFAPFQNMFHSLCKFKIIILAVLVISWKIGTVLYFTKYIFWVSERNLWHCLTECTEKIYLSLSSPGNFEEAVCCFHQNWLIPWSGLIEWYFHSRLQKGQTDETSSLHSYTAFLLRFGCDPMKQNFFKYNQYHT